MTEKEEEGEGGIRNHSRRSGACGAGHKKDPKEAELGLGLKRGKERRWIKPATG